MIETSTLRPRLDGCVAQLGRGHVHVWSMAAPLQAPVADALSRQELQRADAFLRASDRHRFLWRRTMLRNILAGYCNVSAKALAFEMGQHGKPGLAEGRVAFNCTWSDAWIHVAVAQGMDIGVDIEHVRADLDWQSIADIGFNPLERAWISGQPDPHDAFAQVWVRREALFKAWGKGLHDSMRGISLVDDGACVDALSDGQGRDWYLAKLPAPHGYRAALATSERVRAVMLAYPLGSPVDA